MKILPKVTLLYSFGAGLLIGIPLLTALAQSVPQPVLSLTPTGTNNVLLSITNGVNFTNYQIYRTPALMLTGFPWTVSAIGTNGQTNFLVDMGGDAMGFFKALVGSDQDGDGVLDWMDANPNDPTIGALTITIDSPANGSILQ